MEVGKFILGSLVDLVADEVPRDWVTVVIAAVSALSAAFSAWVAFRSTRIAGQVARDSQVAARRREIDANFVRLHELLIDPKAAGGRKKLFITKTEDLPLPGDQGWDEINYSLALYDTLGGYIHQGLVDSQRALMSWHHPLQNIAPHVRRFMEHREANNVNQPWQFLMHLLHEAEHHACTCPHQESSAGVEASPAKA